MQRRTLIASIGTLFASGCISPGGSGGEDSTETTETTETTTEPTVEAPEPELSFAADGGTVTIAHLGGDNVVDEETSKLVVYVDGEQRNVIYHDEEYAFWLADEDQLGEDEASAYTYPLSIGNTVSVEAEAGSTVEVEWYSDDGETEAVLGEFTVPEPTTTEETTATETAETTETTEA